MASVWCTLRGGTGTGEREAEEAMVQVDSPEAQVAALGAAGRQEAAALAAYGRSLDAAGWDAPS